MRVFNVPSSAPFLRSVIAALIDGDLVDGFNARNDPALLAQATLYLPTRRAGRMAREIFLDVMQADAVMLPRILALGDIDEDELAFADAAQSDLQTLEVPPALDGLSRRLLLARLIGEWAARIAPDDPLQAPLVIGGPASTLALADDLARLMDDMTTRGVDWRRLDQLVPDALDQYWQYTLRFLSVAREVWPAILKAHDRIEAAARRDLLIEAEARRLTTHRAGPVIAAGSTGSMPATAKFLHVIANLPNGAVVLPGLDIDLDDEAWRRIGSDHDAAGAVTTPAPGHPQFAMHALLQRFGLKRSDVEPLGLPAASGRDLLLSEAMRPSNATAQWHRRLAEPAVAQTISAGMQNVAVIEAANPEMEALAIAVAIREARELGKTVALVTPDRALARRVMVALGRWSLACDDSGGDALMETPVGIFARLASDAATKQLEPATLLALLKHPLCRLGEARGALGHAVQILELALLRGTRPAPGSGGLAHDLAVFRAELAKLKSREPSTLHGAEQRTKLREADLDQADALIHRLQAALTPLESLDRTGPCDLRDLAARHRDVLIALSCDEAGVAAAFDDTAGAALAAAFDDLLDEPPPSGIAVGLSDYTDVFRTAFGDRVVRRPQTAATAIRIYGPLEARLTQSDRVILGGLIEGVWPPAPRNDPWLSRAMRHELGLDLPERRIGLSAHDFAQLLGMPDVILSRATKAGGAPAVASRFLHRLEAVAGEARWKAATEAGERYIRYAEALDAPGAVKPVEQPMPTPPRAARPLRLSVTAIEDWLRDPYTIYARHILNLARLDPVDMPLSAADRGSAIHNAIGDFTKAFATTLPGDTAATLRQFGEHRFAPLMERPEARALWWPRFLRIAAWFGGWEAERRRDVATIEAEIRGEISIRLDDERTFHLTARADRIERRADRTFAILDYKTGAPPSNKQVFLGLSPQLTLEAAILRGGGFDGIPSGASISELMYVRLSGNNPPGQALALELKLNKGDQAQSPDAAADYARMKLEELIRQFENEKQPYKSLVLPMWTNRYGDYDDLARVKEWSAGGLGEDIE